MKMQLEELCEKIHMPDEVRETIYKCELNVPDYLISGLSNSQISKDCYQKIKSVCDSAGEGLDMLKAQLLAALYTYDSYSTQKIDDKIYFDTMKCFTRFVNEHRESYGYYGFDRGWWTYRQLQMTLFRIGELEYEFREDLKEIHLHIPSDANIALEFSRASLADFYLFAKKYFAQMQDYPIILHSWLISPAIDKLLPRNSKIMKFKKCFDFISWNQEEDEFMQWVYRKTDIKYEELPEETSLQRNMKLYLLKGGKVGGAKGKLIKF
mgnify:FL=1